MTVVEVMLQLVGGIATILGVAGASALLAAYILPFFIRAFMYLMDKGIRQAEKIMPIKGEKKTQNESAFDFDPYD